MKKLLFIVVVITALGFVKPAMAQDENAFSVEGGYNFSYTNVNVSDSYAGVVGIFRQATGGGNPSLGFSFNGGNGEVQYNFWQDTKLKVGILADLAGGHTNSHNTSANVFTYLFGPRVSYGDGKMLPFVEALFGGARGSGSFGGSSGSQNAFAMAVGGGIDWQLNRHWFIRPVEADYVLTEFGGGTSGHQNGFRYAVGVGYRWP